MEPVIEKVLTEDEGKGGSSGSGNNVNQMKEGETEVVHN